VSKATHFAERVARIGEDVTISTFLGYATGASIDSAWNAPDPDDADYPQSGAVPGAGYGAARTERVWTEPVSGKEAEQAIRLPWGDEVRARRKMYCPSDVSVGLMDRVTRGDIGYWVAGIEDWSVGGDLVYRLVWLAEAIE